MTTVTQLLDHLIKAAGDMGKLKDPIPSALIKARARIQHLEGQLAAAETMRDRIAMQLLGDVLVGKLVRNGLNSRSCIEYAYRLADDVLAFRVEGSAGAPGETTSPKNLEPGARFHPGQKVKTKDTNAVGVVVDKNSMSYFRDEFRGPNYTAVKFRNFGDAVMVCVTSNLEPAGEEQ